MGSIGFSLVQSICLCHLFFQHTSILCDFAHSVIRLQICSFASAKCLSKEQSLFAFVISLISVPSVCVCRMFVFAALKVVRL